MIEFLKWIDHIQTPNNTFTLNKNSDGTVTLVRSGSVIQQGTNMSSVNFNRMEFGIFDADLANRLLTLATKNVSGSASGATMFSYGTTDLTPGSSPLETGKLYFVYE